MVYHIVGGKWDNRGVWVEVLEGNPNDIRLIDATQDDGVLITREGLTAGRQMSSVGMPTKVKRRNAGLKQRPLLDAESLWGQLLVSDKFKDTVEEFEPGVHQFFPMELYVGKDLQRTDFFFNICNRLDTMDRERSFPINARGFFRPKGNDKWRLVFSTKKIGDHHAWRDKFVPGGGAYISDELAHRLQDAGITGLHYGAHEQE